MSIKEIAKKLASRQRQIIKEEIPVLILVEGWESSGKGYVIKNIIREMDPRYFKVRNFKKPSSEEDRKPILARYWQMLPEKGEIALFDRTYYQHLMGEKCLYNGLDRDLLRDIESTERQLIDGGMCIIKLFLNISKEVQSQTINNLAENIETKFRVDYEDYSQNVRYDKFKTHFSTLIEKTNFDFSPWNVIDNNIEEDSIKDILKLVDEKIKEVVNKNENTDYKFNKAKYSLLDKVDLDLKIERSDYNKKRKALQKEVFRLSNELYNKKIPVVLVFEGWDAAGKGGSIKRLMKDVDPRGYEVIPIAKPSQKEYSHHYMWRFYKYLPKTGHTAIYDRSWYGRVMVERIEGFAKEYEWKRSFKEINEFEDHLISWGAIVIKFFLHIDKDTQLERFNARKEDPEKRHKITDEDWRNRKKWEQYYEAIDDMIYNTNRKKAPWIIVEAKQKEFARIKVLESFIDITKKFLNDMEN